MRAWNQKIGVLSVLAVLVGCTKYDGPSSPGGSDLVPPTVDRGAPPPPVLTWPANGSKLVPTSTHLQWTGARSATEYDVQVSFTGTFERIEFSLPDVRSTSVPMVTLQPLKFYYWRVRAKNGYGPGSWCVPAVFKTGNNSPPSGS